MSTTVRSHAKINLGLGLGGPRADGFHGLVTLYQTLAAHDLVTVSARRLAGQATTIRLTSNDGRVPTDERNTAWKMVALALGSLGIAAEVAIHIEKRLPVQGGLGAGSANAVAALVGLEAELALEAMPGWSAERLRLAERVGSDVPLFLVGGTVLGLDRGQRVMPAEEIEPTWCAVATPEIGVSTPQAFRDWDALCADELRAGESRTCETRAAARETTQELTEAAGEDRLEQLSRVLASALSGAASFAGLDSQEASGWTGSSGVFAVGEDLAGPKVSALVRTGIGNDFERVVFPQYPFLSEIKHVLLFPGQPEAAVYASLSGSGSSLFGLYRGQRDAEAARERLRAAGVAGFVTRTLPRRDYWREMLQK